eukprot:scaffold20851_cov183-Isochrysis_galbana.AAC.4
MLSRVGGSEPLPEALAVPAVLVSAVEQGLQSLLAPKAAPRAAVSMASTATKREVDLSMLPDDVTLHLLGLLDAGSLSRCAAVSRNLRRLATARQLWLYLLVQRAAVARGWIICERQLEGVSRADVVAALCGSGSVTAAAIPPPRPTDPRALEAAGGISRRRRLPPPPLELPAAPAAAVATSSLLAIDPRVRRMYLISGTSVQFTGPLLGMDRAVRCEAPLPSTPHAWLRAVAGKPVAGTAVAGKPVAEEPVAGKPVAGHACAGNACAGNWCAGSPCAGAACGCASCASHHFVVDRASLVGYFEVTIGPGSDGAGAGRRDCIAVGVGSASFPLHGKQPGWDTCSYGYHSDDGHSFHGHGTSGRPFGETYGEKTLLPPQPHFFPLACLLNPISFL